MTPRLIGDIVTIPSEIVDYLGKLLASGFPKREAIRAAWHAEVYGFDALSGVGCVTFGEPQCGNWNCLVPQHQVLVRDGGSA